MSIEEQIEKLVAANLPEATANEMRKFIEEAAETKREYESILKINKKLNEQIGNQAKKINELSDKVAHEWDIRQREKALDEKTLDLETRERDLEMTVMQTKLEAQTEEKKTVISLVNKVFGVPTVTVTNSKDADVVTPIDGGNHGGYAQKDQVSSFETETTTVDKS